MSSCHQPTNAGSFRFWPTVSVCLLFDADVTVGAGFQHRAERTAAVAVVNARLARATQDGDAENTHMHTASLSGKRTVVDAEEDAGVEPF